jgi:hypothetical protein
VVNSTSPRGLCLGWRRLHDYRRLKSARNKVSITGAIHQSGLVSENATSNAYPAPRQMASCRAILAKIIGHFHDIIPACPLRPHEAALGNTRKRFTVFALYAHAFHTQRL